MADVSDIMSRIVSLSCWLFCQMFMHSLRVMYAPLSLFAIDIVLSLSEVQVVKKSVLFD